LTARKGQIWTVLLLFLFMGSGYTWATWRFFTRPLPGGNDLIAHITAWDAFLNQGVSPYSDEAALYTQQTIRGRPALPGEDQNRMIYPFYSIIVHGPLVYLDHAVARAIYMTLLQAALFVGLYMTIDLIRWRPRNWLLGLMLGWALLYYPQARGVLLGQFAIFGFFSLAGTLFLLKRERDGAAGALLVLSTIKPPLVFLVVPFLLLWATARRRWRFVLGFLGTLAVLSLGSCVFLPTWISEWIYRMRMYSGYTVGQSPVWLLAHTAVPALGQVGEIAISALLLLATLGTWWLSIRPGGDREFLWVLGVTLVVSNLIVPRSATTNYVLMLLPIVWGFAIMDRAGRWGRVSVLVIMLVSLIGLWWLHIVTVVGNQEQPIMFIPSLLMLGLALCLGRRWFVRDAEQYRVYP
jgi:hypothetical protein